MREGGGGSGQRNFDGLDLCWRVLGTRLCSALKTQKHRNTEKHSYLLCTLSKLVLYFKIHKYKNKIDSI